MNVLGRTFGWLYFFWLSTVAAHHIYGHDDKDDSYRSMVPKRLANGTLKPEDLDARGRPPLEPNYDIKTIKRFFTTLFSRPEGPLMPWVRGERSWKHFPDNYEESQEKYEKEHSDFVPKDKTVK